MKELSELLTAIASLLWPILSFIGLLLFKDQLRDLISRLKKGKLLGQEFELRESLIELKEQADVVKEAVLKLPKEEVILSTELDSTPPIDNTEARILKEATKSPKIGLILLASELERELRRTLASLALLSNDRVNLREGVQLLTEKGNLSKEFVETTRLFLDVRNRLIHGLDSTPDEIFSAIDSGLSILKSIQSIPRTIATVSGVNLVIYADDKGYNENKQIKGLLIDTKTADGRTGKTIVPVTVESNYKVGEVVSWEWDRQRVYDTSYYLDSETQKIKPAWTKKVLFVGKTYK